MTELFKDFYKRRLQYGCYYRLLKRTDKSDLLLIFLGTSEFIIVSNYSGVVACGVRSYDYDKKELYYNYKIIQESFITSSTIERLLKKHEIEDVKLKCLIHFERIKNDD